jgi:hypothetical protein
VVDVRSGLFGGRGEGVEGLLLPLGGGARGTRRLDGAGGGDAGDVLRSDSIPELNRPVRLAQDGRGDRLGSLRRRTRLAVVGRGVRSPEPPSTTLMGSIGRCR